MSKVDHKAVQAFVGRWKGKGYEKGQSQLFWTELLTTVLGVPTPEQRARIEKTAQAILDARAAYPDSSLADLYDEVLMPPELLRAHQDNDRAVRTAYGFPAGREFTESDCVAALMKMYQELADSRK